MIKPKQSDKQLIKDIEAYKDIYGFKVWWLGQSGFLIKWKQKSILFDPYLSNSLSVKYQKTDKPHERISELVLDPSWLKNIDIITSSHNHTDHLDAETLWPLFKNNPKAKFIIPEANRDFVVDRLACDPSFPIGLDANLSFQFEGISIHGIPSAHNEVEKDAKGQCKFMGYVLKFGNYSIYHSGDTLWYDDLDNWLKPYDLDIAFLPINGNKPERRVAGNLNPKEAAKLGKEIKAKLVIPHHFHLFEFNTEDPESFVMACKDTNTPNKVLELGEGFHYK